MTVKLLSRSVERSSETTVDITGMHSSRETFVSDSFVQEVISVVVKQRNERRIEEITGAFAHGSDPQVSGLVKGVAVIVDSESGSRQRKNITESLLVNDSKDLAERFVRAIQKQMRVVTVGSTGA